MIVMFNICSKYAREQQSLLNQPGGGCMAQITIDRSQLKELVKEDLAELLRNRKDLLEVVEDLAFGRLLKKVCRVSML
jgi:hypothetical protein